MKSTIPYDRGRGVPPVFDLLRCPDCGRIGEFLGSPPGCAAPFMWCNACSELVPVVQGIADFAPHIPIDARPEGFAQRMMNTSAFGWMYETPVWRPLHTHLVSGHSFKEEVAHVVALASPAPDSLVVDLACGTGPYTRAFSRSGADVRVLGIDLSPGMLRHALRRARDVGDRQLMFLRADMYRLPLPDARVDVVNCAGALHLFGDLTGLWAEISRILRPGGVFTAMTIGWAPGMVARLQQRMVNDGRASFFEHESLAQELAGHGLVDLVSEQRRLGFTFRAVKAREPEEG